MDVVYAIVLVGVLVFVHELGHFVWAKFYKVKVLRFSLGFGPRIAGFRRGDTEYVLAAIPLGGYVRMLGETPHDHVEEADKPHSFGEQALWKRVVIVVAGPAMNLLFPIILYFVVFLGDAQLPPAMVGTVFPGRPADGKLIAGDRIVAIDGDEIRSFDDLTQIVEHSAGRALRFDVERNGEHITTTITPALAHEDRELDLVDDVGRIGITPSFPLAAIGIADPAGPAGAARLQTFDVVVAAGGRPIHRLLDLEKLLDANRGALLPVTYLRPTRVPEALGGFADLEVLEPHVATLAPDPGRGEGLRRAGIESADLYVAEVQAGSPEARMGLWPGDRLVSLDGRPTRLWATFLEDLKAGRGASHQLVYRRGDREVVTHYALEHERGTDEVGQVYDRYAVGIANWLPSEPAPSVTNPHPITYAMRHAVTRTGEVVRLTFFCLVRLVQGRLTTRSIGGPLTIFKVAGAAAREGALNYLTAMAFISINLGLINLLPIPMLDGGHLLFFGVELVSRRPPSLRLRKWASLAGLAALLALVVVAFANDIQREREAASAVQEAGPSE